MSQLLINNDNDIVLIGLKSSRAVTYINDATVQLTLVTTLGGSTEVTGQTFPSTMTYIDPGSDTMGGTAASPTVVKTAPTRKDLAVTVGPTTGLTLSLGRFIRVLHQPEVWKIVHAETAAADADATLRLEPFWWVGWPEDEPQSIAANVGDPVEIVDGSYEAVLDDALEVTKGESYYANISVNATTEGLVGEFVMKLKASYRLL